MGCAQTGTGKTCAFGAPLLQRLAENPKKDRAVRALIVTPTRELAIQIGDNLKVYGKNLPLRSAVIFGGVGQAPQVEQLKKGVHVLTATPGRLLDLHTQKLLDLSKVEVLVLDEADRMLDMGFIHDVKKIVALIPKKRQTLFFSATMPAEVMELVNSLLSDPVRVEVNPVSSPVEVIAQRLYKVDRRNKTKLLAKILKDEQVTSALVFTRTKHGADRVARDLLKKGVGAAAIHGNKSQTARQKALEEFKKGKLQILVATDIAARGLDIEALPYVFNYNLPDVAETYIHRIGRTGRAGQEGTAISFCDYAELSMLSSVEKLLSKAIDEVTDHPYPMVEKEGMVRDSKGRMIHPDDADARNAAKERNQERRQAAALKTAEKKAATITTTSAKPAPQKQAANPPKTTKGGGQQGQQRRSLRPSEKKTLESVLEKAGAETVIAPTAERRSPLEGDVIMDATARLLATKKPLPSAGKSAGRQQNNPSRGGNAPKEQKSRETNNGSNRQNRRSRDAVPTHAAAKIVEKTKAGKAVETEVPKALRRPTRGRGNARRQAPPVELPHSHQKDSTEQPSLMKPFYIEFD